MRHNTHAPSFSEPARIMEIQTENSSNTHGLQVGNFPMAEQLPDCIIVNGEFRDLNSYPLEHYWIFTRKQRPSFINSYNCVRGYTAIWHLMDNQLFLLSVDGYCERKVSFFGSKSARFTLATFLSGGGKPVKADWFSGNLRVPQRNPDKELIITIEKGNLMRIATLDYTQKSTLEKVNTNAKSKELDLFIPVHKALCGQGVKYQLN